VAGPNTTTSTAYTTLTGDPAVTATIGASGDAMVTVTGTVSPELANTPECVAWMSFAVSGATTQAATDARAVMRAAGTSNSTGAIQASTTTVITNLNPGSNTFTSNYRSSAATCTASFSSRTISVIPLG
jgi:hypothetical protein